eukprot:TRINITY_DN72750_c0_g1_i1.p2 TRINITY_DN72750_c0_g1~~TRINITY_DN72750_c0_g1_i1.p2  ORF type:complete len:176 (+),score=41.62 TRINITY_DN72750_c0_g1_i1:146-673(+)
MERAAQHAALLRGSFGDAKVRKSGGAMGTTFSGDGGSPEDGAAVDARLDAEAAAAGGDSVQALMAEVDARWMADAERDEAGRPIVGVRYWNQLRAAWLRVSEAEVSRLPRSFEDPGFLQLARSANAVPVRELSEGELEDLEDCLDSMQRPFPKLRKSVPLAQVIQCAEGLWEADD